MTHRLRDLDWLVASSASAAAVGGCCATTTTAKSSSESSSCAIGSTICACKSEAHPSAATIPASPAGPTGLQGFLCYACKRLQMEGASQGLAAADLREGLSYLRTALLRRQM